MSEISKIRNFCIIAHIDHGKSTLADRLMEISGAVAKREMKDRMLDTLELEQERGITIKLQTVRLNYNGHILNLIDTPGHVDFSYEVSRSVAASEGALLLVDATQGIQAQTLSTVYKAMEYNLKLIPVLNKVDLPGVDIENIKLEMVDTFGFDEDEIILASGKTGQGVKEILDAIVERIPAPVASNQLPVTSNQKYIEEKMRADEFNLGESEDIKISDTLHLTTYTSPVRALIFDAFYHDYKGVVALAKIISGNIKKGEELYLMGTQTKISPIEIGYLIPKMSEQETIFEGEVCYVATGLKDIHKVHPGDTITLFTQHERVTPLEGYRAPKSMVYASLYPVEASDFERFSEALEKLSLNDAALSYQKEYSQALGSGYICGFLGLLHLEITQDRLDREFGIDLISTTPTVEFKVHLGTTDYSKVPNINVSNIDRETNYATIRTAAEFPDGSVRDEVLEPWVRLEILTPEEYVGDIMQLCQQHRGIYKSMSFLSKSASGTKHALMIYEIPTVEIIVNFFDKLKSVTHGYGSMDYSFLDYKPSDIVKVGILINEELVEAMSFLTHRSNAERKGRAMVTKLTDIIPRQQFKVPIQAAIGGNIIARETIPAYRKDVLSKLYGGDVTRKMKLLEKQKKGKKKMKMFGKVEIPKEAFLAALKDE
jgi:GTP-binding protein LepA